MKKAVLFIFLGLIIGGGIFLAIAQFAGVEIDLGVFKEEPTEIAVQLQATDAITPKPTAETTPAPTEFVPDANPNLLLLPVPNAYNEWLIEKSSSGMGEINEVIVDFNTNDEWAAERPQMPAYIWHINPEFSDNIENIVVEFKLLDTMEEQIGNLCGYDRGYFIGLYNLQDMTRGGVSYDVHNPYDAVVQAGDHGSINMDEMLTFPEFSVDMRGYEQWNDDLVRITIPYEQFTGGARDLTLQFLPGAKYAGLRVFAEGSELSEDMIDELLREEYFEYESLNIELNVPEYDPEMSPEDTMEWIANYGLKGLDEIETFKDKFYRYYGIITPISELDLGEYADEVSGSYVLDPAEIPWMYTKLNSFNSKEKGLQKVIPAFMYNNMRNPETGLICGYWDVKTQEHVALDRRVANLPFLASISRFCLHDMQYLTHSQQGYLFTAMLEHEVIEIEGKKYYAPYGLNEDNSIILKLSDFYGTSFINFIDSPCGNHTKQQRAHMHAAVANSLELILECAEMNPTKLPTNEIKVTFTEDGYTLEAIGDVFCADNDFLGIGLHFNNDIGGIAEDARHMEYAGFKVENFDHMDENSAGVLRHTFLLTNYRNSFASFTYINKILLNIYNFQRIQNTETVFAPAYNVVTGEPVFFDNPDGTQSGELYSRYGGAKETINYVLLGSMFSDNKMMEDAVDLTLHSRLLMESEVFGGEYRPDRDLQYYIDNYPGYVCEDQWSFRLLGIDGKINVNDTYSFMNGPMYFSWRMSVQDFYKWYVERMSVKPRDDQQATLDEAMGEPVY